MNTGKVMEIQFYKSDSTYRDEFGEYEKCMILSCPINNSNLTLIQFENGDRGFCSANLLDD